MAGVAWQLSSAPVLCTTSTKTIVQIIAAANHRVLLEYCKVTFQGIVATDAPIQCEILIGTSAGTSSALTVNKWNPADDETLLITALEAFTVEGTSTTVKLRDYVHPQGKGVWTFGMGLPVLGGTRMNFRVVTPGVSVNTIVEMRGTE